MGRDTSGKNKGRVSRRKSPSPKWVTDHPEDIESISQFVTQKLEEHKSKRMARRNLFDEIRDEFGAKFLRKMMGMESKAKLDVKCSIELFQVLQHQHFVKVTKEGSNGVTVIELKTEETPEPLAKWCVDHKEQVKRIQEFVVSTLTNESSHEMTKKALFQEIRDEFGAKGLRKMMQIEKRGEITDDRISELFEALKRNNAVDIEEGEIGSLMIRLKSEKKERRTKEKDIKIKESEKKTKEKEREIKKKDMKSILKTKDKLDIDKEKERIIREIKKNSQRRLFAEMNGAKKNASPEMNGAKMNGVKKSTSIEDDNDDMKIQEPPFKKAKLDRYVEKFNKGNMSQDKMVLGITKLFRKSKQKLEIHFHFELPEEDEDVDMDSSDSSSSSDNDIAI